MFELLFTHPLWAYRTGQFAFASAWPLWLLVASILLAVGVIVATLWRRRQLGLRLLLPVGILQSLLAAAILCLLWRPVLNVERVRDRENVLAVAIDASASMAYGDADPNRSRLQDVAAALQKGTLAKLEDTFDVRLFSFSQTTTPLESLDAIPAPGPQTRIGDSLVQVLQSAGSVPLAGVVLFSDGAENGGSLSEERLTELASYGVPIHTVGVGPEQNRGRSGAGAARAAGERADRLDGHCAGRNPPLRRRDDAAARLRPRRDHRRARHSAAARFERDQPGDRSARRRGRHARVAVRARSGRRRAQHHQQFAHARGRCPASRRNILYVEGEPRWEYKFLRRAAERDRALRVASVVHTTPNKYYRQGIDSPGELADGFPANAAELYAYDAVVIGSYEAASLRPEQHQLLKEFVDQRGGSVLMLAGRHGLAAGGWQNAALAQTLPAQLGGRQVTALVQRPLRAQPTLYGVQSPILRFDPDPKRNAEPLEEPAAAGRLPGGRPAEARRDRVAGRHGRSHAHAAAAVATLWARCDVHAHNGEHVALANAAAAGGREPRDFLAPAAARDLRDSAGACLDRA